MDEIRENGTRFDEYRNYEELLHTPYEYKKHGLMNKLISKNIIDSKNRALRLIITLYDQTFFYLLSKVDRLKNFKNWLSRNR